MKRLFAFLLFLFLLFPSFAYPDTMNELIGTWVGCSDAKYGEVDYFLVTLYDDYSAIYETSRITMFDSEGLNFVHNATWDLQDDGVHVHYRNFWDSSKEEDFVLELTQAHYLAHKLVTSYILFVKLPGTRKTTMVHTVSTWDEL